MFDSKVNLPNHASFLEIIIEFFWSNVEPIGMGISSNCAKLSSGAKVLLHNVQRPELYGVAKFDKKYKII